MRRFLSILSLPILLAACTAEPVWAPDDAVARAAYVHDGPPSITLFTMVNNRSNEGAHSGLLINGSERVIFDPAGSWWHRSAPERNDLIYGITPTMLRFYVDFHARETYRVVTHSVIVAPEVAEQAIRLAQDYGAVPKASCSIATSRIVQQLPGFENVKGGLFPARLMRSFSELPGVQQQVYLDDDSDNNSGLLLSQQSASFANQPSQ